MPVLFKRLMLLAVLSAAFLSACATVDRDKAALVLKPARFRDLPGWRDGDQEPALAAFAKSCERILKRDPADAFGPVGGTYGDWQPACRGLPAQGSGQARSFFEQWFSPYKATFDGRDDEGLFTGYYEPTLHGSPIKSGPYAFPLYKRPDDLVMVDLGEFRDDLKGKRIAGRVIDAHLKPYEDREQITKGNWPHNDDALVWVDDPVDAFFLHIQGSGRVEFSDGSFMRVGYDGQNGYAYYAIGRELVKRGYMDKKDVSLQSIRAWLGAHPDEGREIMFLNKSYVFFKPLTGNGPLGAEGLELTPGRSLAVDRTKVPYGTPLWVDIEPPTADEKPLERLMVAQDTGGAITGAVRGDVFWGHGDRAAYLAGHMKAQGRYWLLLPKNMKD